MRIPLDRSYRGLLVTELVVYSVRNDRPVKLTAAVDTGASSVIIPVEAGTLLGYAPESASEDRVITGRGVAYAPRITVTRMEVGGASAGDVDALCHDLPEESAVDALVGLSFLTRFHVGFDFDAWEMDLVPRSPRS